QMQNELNGPLITFGERFWGLGGSQHPQIATVLETEKITKLTYSDRYITNEAVITIIRASFLPLKRQMAESATTQIRTLFKTGRTQGQKAFDDWSNQEDFQFFAEKWISAMVGTDVDFVIETSNRDIPHHRRLDLELESGKTLKVRFDQG